MKQKIVIEMRLKCDKAKRKALAKAITTSYAGTIDWCGFNENKDHVVVVGDNIEPSCLVRALRKKYGYAKTISVEPVDTQKKEEVKKEEAKKEDEKDAHHGNIISYGYPNFPNPNIPPQVVFYGMPADPPPTCIIM